MNLMPPALLAGTEESDLMMEPGSGGYPTNVSYDNGFWSNLKDRVGLGPVSTSMYDDRGLANPKAQAFGHALQRISAINQGKDPGASTASVMNRAMLQNQALMQRKAEMLERRQDRKMENEVLRRRLDPMYAFESFVSSRGLEDQPYESQLEAYQMFNRAASLSGSRTPADLQIYQAYSQMTPEQRKVFQEANYRPQFLNLGDRQIDPVSGREFRPGLAPNETPEYKEEAGAASSRGSAIGTAEGEKIGSAAIDLRNADEAISTIDRILNHPGREAATGFSSIGNVAPIPGSDRADFLTVARQLRGKAFLEAYQSLKGGGQITEIEGTKAEQAQARLNEAQSEEAYVEALNEMKQLIQQRKQKIESMQSNDGWVIEPVE